MTEVEYLGARLEKDIVSMVKRTADEQHVDKTTALKDLIVLGRKQVLLRKYLELYRTGGCSIDKAAAEVGLTVAEMMEKASHAGIQSTQTIAEYRKGLELLD
jgi:hypothetical protein